MNGCIRNAAMNQIIRKPLLLLAPTLVMSGALALGLAPEAPAQSPYFPSVHPLPPSGPVSQPAPTAPPLRFEYLTPQYVQPLPPVRVFGVRPYGAWSTYGYGSSQYVRVYGGAGSNLPPPEVVPQVFVPPAPDLPLYITVP
jgi:hypothetical protein